MDLRFVITSFLIFMTLANFCMGAPIEPNPKTNRPNPKAEPSQPENVLPLQQVDVTIPPPITPSEPPYFYQYSKSLSAYGGLALLSPAEGTLLTYGLMGGSFLWHSATSIHIESGFEAVTSGQGQFWTGTHINWRSTERFRPFWTIGVGVKLFAERGMASFLMLSNYFFRGSMGAEYSFWGPLSWRGEFFIAPDIQGHGFFGGTLGVSFGL